jgi:hypothetical protein
MNTREVPGQVAFLAQEAQSLGPILILPWAAP